MRLVVKSTCLIPCLALLVGCGPVHKLNRLENGDHTLVATSDYMSANLGLTHDVLVSVQEKQGLAYGVATFRNVPQPVKIEWLGPEDLNICPSGSIVGYQTAVVLNTLKGKRTVHAHYDCNS